MAATGEKTRAKATGGNGGKGRGRFFHTKGRQADPAALAEVRALLADRPRRRDLLIEHLHLLNDAFGHLSARHLDALAREMRLAQAEVYEVATFYHHFEVVKEGGAAPPATVIRVCDSLTCALLGAERLIAELGRRAGPGVRVLRAPCIGACDRAPAAACARGQVAPADAGAVLAALERGRAGPEGLRPVGLAAYRAAGGYRTLADVRGGTRGREDVLAALDSSGLKGLGGAGFPPARKWRFVIAGPKPRYLAVNADEGEPGTFKDRVCLERDPHRVLEGALIAAAAIEAEAVYLYLRDEYPWLHDILAREIAAIEEAGLGGGVAIELRRGAGAYICGEESAMLESIEGRRGYPRHKPPFPAQVGLFGRPTAINNVETLYWVRDILEKGPDWFAAQGANGAKGLRMYSVSGRVKEPGVKIAPAGVTARELIERYSGGMAEGHSFKGYLPGGASGGILPATMADIPLDFGRLEAHGCFVGSAAVIVLSQADSAAAAALNLMRFFEHESCGQCTPCRVGTEKASALMAGRTWDAALLKELSQAMRDASICGLGQAAPNPLLSVLKFFPEEVT
ncbi:MAG: NAD(P)H-dependent oxidoreductase subunit E [Proteobacteria bacterium]|nr:NAD(P)H-dependent oxidoreductase subunit E [Pseudomonadota bacterium]